MKYTGSAIRVGRVTRLHRQFANAWSAQVRRTEQQIHARPGFVNGLHSGRFSTRDTKQRFSTSLARDAPIITHNALSAHADQIGFVGQEIRIARAQRKGGKARHRRPPKGLSP
jgi:hypothetical protein